jgi:hypothetical protein
MEEEAIISEWNERQRQRERDSQALRAGEYFAHRPAHICVRKIHRAHNSNVSSIPHYLYFIRAHIYGRIPMICAGFLRERLNKQTNAYVKLRPPSTAVTCPLPLYFLVFPFSLPTILSTGMLVVTIKRLELLHMLRKDTEV